MIKHTTGELSVCDRPLRAVEEGLHAIKKAISSQMRLACDDQRHLQSLAQQVGHFLESAPAFGLGRPKGGVWNGGGWNRQISDPEVYFSGPEISSRAPCFAG